MAKVVSGNSVVQFQRAGSDDQIGEWHRYPLGRLFPSNPRDNLGGSSGDRMDLHMLFQIVQKPAPVL